MRKTRIVVSSLTATALVAISVAALAPPAAADARKAGTAEFYVLGLPYNADSGDGSQKGHHTGPHGDAACRCYDFRLGICHSWEIHGYYASYWFSGVWDGSNSGITFPGSGSAIHRYDAYNGFETMCNTTAVAMKIKAEALAVSSAKSFHTLAASDGQGSTSAGAHVPFTSLGAAVPYTMLSLKGRGQWLGTDISWSFSFSGDAYYGGIKVCSNCVRATGKSLA